MKIIDNLLPNDIFGRISSMIMQHDGYRCLDYTVYKNESDGSIDQFGEYNPNSNTKKYEVLFTTDIYNTSHNAEVTYDLYHYLRDEFKELYRCLNVKKMILMRANCTIATTENYRSSFHVDINKSPYEGIGKTAILYLNTNNGGTQIKNDAFVRSIANSAVIFTNTTEHAGVWATDKKLRFVLNLNYLEN